MAAPFEASSLQPGQRVLGRYELVRELGRGGMGVVWLVRDHGLGIDVAFKFLPDVLRQDRVSLDELRDEARRNLRLTNESIVRIHDFVEDATLAGITMEYVDGDTLASRKVESPNRMLDVEQLWPLVRQLCRALHYAHTQPRVVHRDLKPANLMVTRDGRLKITDFGIARSICDSVTRVSNAQPSSGTLVYMSPQQLMGEPPQPTDDIYSIGATIYDLLSGKPPFHTGSIAAQLLQSTPCSMTERRAQLERFGAPIPEAWEEAVAACLAKTAEQRPATALEIIRRIEGGSSSRVFDPGETISEPIVVTPRPTAPPVRTPPPRPPADPQFETDTVASYASSASPRPVPAAPAPATEHPTPPWTPPPAAPPPTPRSSSGIWIGICILLFLLLVGAGAVVAYFAKDHFARTPTPPFKPAPDPIVIPQPPPPVSTGRILLNSVPTGARVWMNGSELGVTPLTIDPVTAGDHQLRLVRTDYEPLDLHVEVVGGQTANTGVVHLVPIPRKPDPVPDTPPKVAPSDSNPFANTPNLPVETGLTDVAAENAAARLLTATEQRNIDNMLGCYSNPVDYFDEGVLTPPKLIKSLRNYVQVWPIFDIQVLKSEVSATGDPNEKIVGVSYRFVARNGAKVASGIAHDTITVRRYSDGIYIRRIRQTVTDRQKNY